MFNRSLARIVILAFLLVPAGATAGTIYNFTTGSAVISATILDLTLVNPPTPVLLNGSPTVNVAVTGNTIEFDDIVGELNDFDITLDDTGSLALSPTVFGYTSASFTGLTLGPSLGYDGLTGVSGGPNNFTFSVGPVEVSGSFSATSATPPLPPDIVNLAFTAPSPTLDGSISVGGNMIQLLGITLGGLTNPLNANEVLVFKGDIVFNASVPEPVTTLLIGTALSCLLLRRRSQR